MNKNSYIPHFHSVTLGTIMTTHIYKGLLCPRHCTYLKCVVLLNFIILRDCYNCYFCL